MTSYQGRRHSRLRCTGDVSRWLTLGEGSRGRHAQCRAIKLRGQGTSTGARQELIIGVAVLSAPRDVAGAAAIYDYPRLT